MRRVKCCILVVVISLIVDGGYFIATQTKTPRQNVETKQLRGRRKQRGYGYYDNYNYPRPYGALPPSNSLVAALESIAQNDELDCVPRLVCELTSGGSGRGMLQLPFGVDGESLIGLLSLADGKSALVTFAKAALLGYVSKPGSQSCMEAYTRCPKDPDKLVQYLNNYNGGFFRFFGGNRSSQRRILTNNNNSKGDNKGIQMFAPTEQENGIIGEGVKFPSFSALNELPSYRELDDYVKISFPDRTGTGELRLDDAEFDRHKTNIFQAKLQDFEHYTNRKSKGFKFPDY